MSGLFLDILNRSISASWLVLAVLLIRFALKKAPKWIRVILWGIVAFRLICPFTMESPFSLIPASVGNGELVSEWLGDFSTEVAMPQDHSAEAVVMSAGNDPVSIETKYNQSVESSAVCCE